MAKKIGFIPYKVTTDTETGTKTFEICLVKQNESLIPFTTYAEQNYNAVECAVKRAKMNISFVPEYGANIKKLFENNDLIIFALKAESCSPACEWVTEYSFLPEEYTTGLNKINK